MQLPDADLTFLELDLKYHPEKDIDRKQLLSAVEELRAWRDIGPDPQTVTNQIEALRWDLEVEQDRLLDLELQLNASQS